MKLTQPKKVKPNNFASLTADEIAACLSSRGDTEVESRFPHGLIATQLRRAAVMIPFLKDADRWHLLFIRRTTKRQDPHSGQVAFPGGANEPGDTDLQATALREMYEEIGVRSEDVRILGSLHDFVTITSYLVTPFVGVIPWPYPLKLEQSEVSRAFTIPLEWLADPGNHQVRQRALPPPYDPVPVIYFEPYDGEVLWGATAGFTMTLLNVLTCAVL
jgi:8-oxo-dGTP pyrophosphatase MutT (NUDIX family)